MNITKDSRYLSYLLRHHPESINLTLDSRGWANISELIKKTDGTFNMEYLEEIVRTDEKKRYSFNEDKTKIRANQGHSINVNPDLKEETPPKYLYHGTALRFLDAIKKEGIKKQSRSYVHLSKDEQTALKVGKRHGEPVILIIEAEKMYNDGIKFYKSENGVWLTDYVEPKYFTKKEGGSNAALYATAYAV